MYSLVDEYSDTDDILSELYESPPRVSILNAELFNVGPVQINTQDELHRKNETQPLLIHF